MRSGPTKRSFYLTKINKILCHHKTNVIAVVNKLEKTQVTETLHYNVDEDNSLSHIKGWRTNTEDRTKPVILLYVYYHTVKNRIRSFLELTKINKRTLRRVVLTCPGTIGRPPTL